MSVTISDAYMFDIYDRTVINLIVEKYGFSEKTALRSFLLSKTYRMLTDPKLEMWEFSPVAVFDMWEAEKITGDPRNSVYLRRE